MVEKIIWTAKSRNDLDEIYLSFSDYSEKYANQWVDRLFAKLELLEKFPEIGVIVPEKELSFIREIFVGNSKLAFSYLNNQVTILRIVHKGSPFGKL
jgi:toxin ParE1/3/4